MTLSGRFIFMARFIGFLRGINVGGRNRLNMKLLVSHLDAVGGLNVTSYIQSGNLLFSSANLPEARKLAAACSKRLDDKEGIQSPIVVRSVRDVQKAVSTHPFAQQETDERMVSIGFLSKKVTDTQAALLAQNRSPGDQFLVSGGELYLHTPLGMGKSKLTVGYFDSKLGVTTTVRNMKTLRALIALES